LLDVLVAPRNVLIAAGYVRRGVIVEHGCRCFLAMAAPLCLGNANKPKRRDQREHTDNGRYDCGNQPEIH
jgi:hypothetical protein